MDRLADYSSSFIVLAACVVAGLVVDQVVFTTVRRRAAERRWAPGAQLVAGIHGLPTAAGVVLGAHYALLRADLPARTLSTAQRAVTVFAILATTAFLGRGIAKLVRVYTEREGSRLPSTSIFVNLARGLVWVLGLMIVLGSLGVSVAPLLTALGVGGLAVGLALQPTLENVFSGIQLLASRQINPGDLVRLQTGEEGTIIDVTWRNTTIRTGSNDLVIVPNSILGRSLITNFSCLEEAHELTVPILLPVGSDLAAAEQVALAVARDVVAEVPGAAAGAEPTARFAEVRDTGVVLNVSVRVRSYRERLAARSELVKRLHAELLGDRAPAAPSVAD